MAERRALIDKLREHVGIAKAADGAVPKRAYEVRIESHGSFIFAVGAETEASAREQVDDAYSDWSLSNEGLEMQPIFADQQVDVQSVRLIRKYECTMRTPKGVGAVAVFAPTELDAAESAAARYRIWEAEQGFHSPDDAVVEVMEIKEVDYT